LSGLISIEMKVPPLAGFSFINPWRLHQLQPLELHGRSAPVYEAASAERNS
jgi:hypothetical protein